jgi:hypothetical protein
VIAKFCAVDFLLFASSLKISMMWLCIALEPAQILQIHVFKSQNQNSANHHKR